MYMLEQIDNHEVNGIVLRAFSAAADESEYMVEVRVLQIYLNNELVDTVSSDVIDFFDDFGFDVDANNITPEMLEASGVDIPRLDMDAVKKIIINEGICFTEDGLIFNDPQISCLTIAGKHEKNERRHIVYLR